MIASAATRAELLAGLQLLRPDGSIDSYAVALRGTTRAERKARMRGAARPDTSDYESGFVAAMTEAEGEQQIWQQRRNVRLARMMMVEVDAITLGDIETVNLDAGEPA